jgi:hypothetical protein
MRRFHNTEGSIFCSSFARFCNVLHVLRVRKTVHPDSRLWGGAWSAPISSASVAPTSVGMFTNTFWLFCVPSCRAAPMQPPVMTPELHLLCEQRAMRVAQW